MEKKNILWFILNHVFVVVFNVLFFVIGGTEHNTSVWISYGFIHFAYFMLLLTPKLIRAGKSSAVFGFSLYAISATYFLVEFVIGMLFILMALGGYKFALFIQLIMAGAYIVMLVSHLLANENTANTEEKRKVHIDYVKDASIRIKLLLEQVHDKEAKKLVEKVYDTLHSSPVKSHPSLVQTEERILQSIDTLEGIIATGNREKIISSANSLLGRVNTIACGVMICYICAICDSHPTTMNISPTVCHGSVAT